MRNQCNYLLFFVAGLQVPMFAFASTDFDPPVITSVSFSSTSLDVSSSSQDLTVTMNVTDSSGIDASRSYVRLKHDVSGLIKNLTSCIYEAPLLSCTTAFSSTDAAGQWDIDFLNVYDGVGNAVWVGNDVALDSVNGGDTIFTLEGGNTDFDPPVITSVSFSSTSLDVSSSSQDLTVTMNVTDSSGIDASRSYVRLKHDVSGLIKNLTSCIYEAPLLSCTTAFSSTDAAGQWDIDFLNVYDGVGNAVWVGNDVALDSVNGGDTIFTLEGGNTDFDPPVITSVSFSSTSLDVSSSSQDLTVTMNVTDSSGIDASRSYVRLKHDVSGLIKNLTSCIYEAPLLSCTTAFSSTDAAGQWDIDFLNVYDGVGNAVWVGNDVALDSVNGGLSVVSVLDGSVTTTDLSLTASTPGGYLFAPSAPDTSSGTSFSGGVSMSNVTIEGSNVWITGATTDYYTTYPFSITNNSSSISKDVTLKIYGSGVYRAGFNHDAGTSSCYTTSINTETLVTQQNCTLSAFTAGEKRDYVLTLGTTDSSTTATLNLSMYSSEPEVNMDDNSGYYSFSFTRDADSDGVANALDAFPNDATETKDTDSDGVGDNADAFPSDASETIDTDSDGIGNNADTDDDGDGLSDTDEATAGTKVLVADTDGDGSNDGSDALPLDATETLDTDTDGIGNNADTDDDGDGVEDTTDAFPLDATETLDTDSDGIGNNADTDDDGDGFSDAQEAIDGTDPLSKFSCQTGCFSFDIDNSTSLAALTDGLLVIRHLFGFTGDTLIASATDTSAIRNSAADISAYLTAAESELDIDGSGDVTALTDGLLLIRYLFGFSGDSLISGALGTNATRTTSSEIEDYIKARVPSS